MADSFARANVLRETLVAFNEEFIAARLAEGRRGIRRYTYMLAAYIVLATSFSVGLLWLFYSSVVRPVRQMARDAQAFAGIERSAAPAEALQDELHAVGFHLRRLMSDVRETRSDLQRSREQLSHAEKLASVGKLAASVAHEIRNPLTSLRMRVYSLRSELAGNPTCEDDLRVVSDEIVRLDSVIRNFLEFARAPEIRPRAQAVAPLIDAILELCGHRLIEKDIHLARDDAIDQPDVYVDGEQVKQVLLNLVLNACEAMSEGGRLFIFSRVETAADGHRMVRVRVHDTGPGIPPEMQTRILDPFFTTKESGTGLGLCIAASIMIRHGGSLELESSGPGGSCFTVSLPIAPEATG